LTIHADLYNPMDVDTYNEPLPAAMNLDVSPGVDEMVVDDPPTPYIALDADHTLPFNTNGGPGGLSFDKMVVDDPAPPIITSGAVQPFPPTSGGRNFVKHRRRAARYHPYKRPSLKGKKPKVSVLVTFQS
jgi:hypothetical protein